MEVEYSKQALNDLEFWKKNASPAIKNKITALISDIQKNSF